MLKTVDVPLYLREFNSLFTSLGRRHDASRLFDDFLTIIICCLARLTLEPLYLETVKRYQKEELNDFAKLFGSLLLIYQDALNKENWIDPLGEYYEALASNHKKSGFGQFFTPKAICDMLAQLTVPADDYGNNINDCACGSGRTLLAANQICKGNHYIAQDIDHICVKMCAINMALHGLKGEVYHMDTLRNNTPWNTYIINHDWHKTKTPFIYKL